MVQNCATALDHANKAATTGSIRALAPLAVLYGESQGMPRDNTRSPTWPGG